MLTVDQTLNLSFASTTRSCCLLSSASVKTVDRQMNLDTTGRSTLLQPKKTKNLDSATAQTGLKREMVTRAKTTMTSCQATRTTTRVEIRTETEMAVMITMTISSMMMGSLSLRNPWILAKVAI